MQFCPTCANVLLVEDSGNLRFFCQTCPYIFNITGKVTRKLEIKKIKTDGEVHEKAWDRFEKTDVICPHCKHTKAAFVNIERTVGEKPISFYRCEDCKKKWSSK